MNSSLERAFSELVSFIPRNRIFGLERQGWPFEDLEFRVDLRDDGEQYILTADLPGVTASELEVTLEDDLLTVSCERKASTGEDFFLRETRCGKLTRSFKLPSANPEKVDATLKDGVLTLTISKEPESKPRRIEIKC